MVRVEATVFDRDHRVANPRGICCAVKTTRFSVAWSVVIKEPSAANRKDVCASGRACMSDNAGTAQLAAASASTTEQAIGPRTFRMIGSLPLTWASTGSIAARWPPTTHPS